jgi:NAD(P)-dependent dehydrogenase (short-subunit alcohol dehydrogenase family)
MRTWIIGGTSGIGAAVADRIRYSGNGPQTLLLTDENVDVTEPFALMRYIGRHKPIHEVVFCAGVNHPEMIGDGLTHKARITFDVNVVGFLNVLDQLRSEQGHQPTSIVAVTSDAARIAMRGSIAYCASKAALSHAIRCAARELAPTWRVNGVAPGIIADTPMTAAIDRRIPSLRGWTPEYAAEYEKSMIPMRRRGRPDEVARVIVDALRGPEYMTGTIVEITGGK